MIEIFLPTSLLNIVDFPTFGRPTKATVGVFILLPPYIIILFLVFQLICCILLDDPFLLHLRKELNLLQIHLGF